VIGTVEIRILRQLNLCSVIKGNDRPQQIANGSATEHNHYTTVLLSIFYIEVIQISLGTASESEI
jgi:hypothetical protein